MARSIRIEYAGAYYHVMARGNRRESIFRDDDDRRFFLRVLSEACGMTGWRVHAWVLLGNHYTALRDYIHLNPVRAGLVKPEAGHSVLDYPWSSLAGVSVQAPGRRAKWLAAAAGLGGGDLGDTVAGRRWFVERLDRRAAAEGLERAGVPASDAGVDGRTSHLRRGWYWGRREFAERALEIGASVLSKGRHRSYKAARESRAHGESEAWRLLDRGLSEAGLTVGELARLSGCDKRKVAIAREIRERTAVSLGWISEHLRMKSAANVSLLLSRAKRKTRG